MGYGAKRLAEIEAERKARREEKARIKKEKEEEKKRLKKIEHKKKLRKKQNQRAYKKRRQIELDKRKSMGDEYAYYSVYITKNRKKIRFVGTSWWKTDAYKIYNEAIERNRAKTKFKKTVFTTTKNGKTVTEDVKYEILLVKKTNGNEETVSSFKNDIGKYVDNVIADWDNHVIVDKNEWFVEEGFHIYGYHPYKEKKTYNFILNNLLLENEDCGDEMRRIMVYKNHLIIHYLDDFDFITCYDVNHCERLYDMLQSDITKLKKKYIVYMGRVVPELTSSWIDKFEEKTGWNRYKLYHKTTKN